MTNMEKDEKNTTQTRVIPAGERDDEHGYDYSHQTENHHINLAEADDAAAFVAGFSGEIDPKEADRVRRKIDWNLLPLMYVLIIHFNHEGLN
jgi:ACS family allantoate permease-like MFS transporter